MNIELKLNRDFESKLDELSKKYEVEIVSLYRRSDKPFYRLNKNW